MTTYFVGELAEQELIPFIRDKDFNEGDMDLDSLTDKTGGKFLVWKM